jgi:hypothetical protein
MFWLPRAVTTWCGNSSGAEPAVSGAAAPEQLRAPWRWVPAISAPGNTIDGLPVNPRPGRSYVFRPSLSRTPGPISLSGRETHAGLLQSR